MKGEVDGRNQPKQMTQMEKTQKLAKQLPIMSM